MKEALAINAADSAVANASDRLHELLCLLGQDGERGYRKALRPLWNKHPGTWSGPRWSIETAVYVLNFVVFAADFQGRLSDEKLADLVSFFLERLRHMEKRDMESLP